MMSTRKGRSDVGSFPLSSFGFICFRDYRAPRFAVHAGLWLIVATESFRFIYEFFCMGSLAAFLC